MDFLKKVDILIFFSIIQLYIELNEYCLKIKKNVMKKHTSHKKQAILKFKMAAGRHFEKLEKPINQASVILFFFGRSVL